MIILIGIIRTFINFSIMAIFVPIILLILVITALMISITTTTIIVVIILTIILIIFAIIATTIKQAFLLVSLHFPHRSL